MSDMFNFEEALSYMKSGFKVINSRKDIYYIDNANIYCIPKSQAYKGVRKITKLYVDSILSDDWNLVDDGKI